MASKRHHYWHANLARCAAGAALCASLMAQAAPQLDYVPGPRLPEDLVMLPGTGWVLASSMSLDKSVAGGLYAVSGQGAPLREVYPANAGSAAWDRQTYADCPGPPDPRQASPHGIYLHSRSQVHTLYAVNHGGRESIEVFKVELADGAPRLSWLGCVLLPADAYPNGVAALPSGGFVVTKMYDRSSPDGALAMLRGEATGALLKWTPAAGWSTLPGPALAAPNGIELSPDGRSAYVASWTRRQLLRVPLAGQADKPAALDLDFMPDNLRGLPDGSVLVTGQATDPAGLVACVHKGQNCPAGFKVVVVSPQMTARELYRSDDAQFTMPTVALPVGDELWIGSVRGSQIARVRSALPASRP
ncbi:SMP-30/gluconolactonase/LRE family protein [Aquabacterium sp.]|uniref:SMP-30/gluconolactonase/LRE family protein n=1 Tax=Aquabacterium sp. TaxID=1872578 RepID=UPI002C7DEE75|nr:SMP-30/gluconolactonase/LRE family protein [Aquabacterium sp.]HSW06774.1 SMP-30/gluconolactonase/LRE family protein [Aquabacterium sp.]